MNSSGFPGNGFSGGPIRFSLLDESVEALAASLAEKPKLALLATKRHANAAADEVAGVGHSWSDADGLLAALRDPESRASADRYLARMKSGDPKAR